MEYLWFPSEERKVFLKSKVVFLGLKIDHHGIQPIGPTLDAITRAKVPSNVTELRSFIGMVNHYGRFIKQLSTKLRPRSTQFIMFRRAVALG